MIPLNEQYRTSKDLKLWAGVNDSGKRWMELSSKCFDNTRSSHSLCSRWNSLYFKKRIAETFGPDAYGLVNDRDTAAREEHQMAGGSASSDTVLPSQPAVREEHRQAGVCGAAKRVEQIPYISFALAKVLLDTSSVSFEMHTTIMMDMTRSMDPNHELVISLHDIDANVLGQLFEREIHRLSEQTKLRKNPPSIPHLVSSSSSTMRSISLLQSSPSGKDELSGDFDENGRRRGPIITTSSADNQEHDQVANSDSLEVDLSDICSDNDDQGKPLNIHRIIDENPFEYNEDEHEEIHLSDEILMIRERIWTVFACIGRGIVTDQEVIVRSYMQPQQNGPDASDICKNFLYDNQSRSFTSIVRLMEIVYRLLATNQFTTLRSLYYALQSHFHNQTESNRAVMAICKILKVSRHSLGIIASSKGLFCGSIEITRKGTRSGHVVNHYIDGSTMEIEGILINSEWIERNDEGKTKHGIDIQIVSKNAKVILVIEQDGIYRHLAANRIFDRYPCILVTGKGFPDVATRALVHALHRELRIPVVGLCDCNPFGVSLLSTYYDAGESMGIDGGRRYSVPVTWIGLRPTDVDQIKSNLLPDQLQPLSENDQKKIDTLLRMDADGFVTDEVKSEVQCMRDLGVKVQLDALHWIGQYYMTNWVVKMLQNGGKVFSTMGEAANAGNVDEVIHVNGRGPSTRTSTSTASAKAKLEPHCGSRKRHRSNAKEE